MDRSKQVIDPLPPEVQECIDTYGRYYAEQHKLGMSVRDDMKYVASVALRAATSESDIRDAARYRWLRLNADNEFTDRDSDEPILIAKGVKFSRIGWSEEIDAAIDAKLSATDRREG
jgi:hypothetical protein